MAMADYYLCDQCGGKTFYDTGLDWRYEDDEGNDCEANLRGVGDMVVICEKCAAKFEVVVMPKRKGVVREVE
jgi:hypothetical protein